MHAIYAPTAPAWLRHVPAVAVLRQVWLQQYYGSTASDVPVRWRAIDDLPPGALLIHSPYDVEADGIWIDLVTPPASFVIYIGDMMQR